MKPEFLEDFQNPDHDPLDSTTADFDWNAVSAHLGEELAREDKQKLALALRLTRSDLRLSSLGWTRMKR